MKNIIPHREIIDRLKCPLCSSKMELSNGDRSLVCLGARRHCYDISSKGYVNLMPPGRAQGGDSRDAVKARKDFLSLEYYSPAAEAIANILEKHLNKGDVIVDAGCGEGYYTDGIARALAEAEISVSAFDISRDAVKFAYKRNPSISFAVASAYKMPVADGSFSGAINMFSPLAADEVRRSLCEGGIFIMAIPAENHLFGLKKATYRTPYKNEVADKTLAGFDLIEEVSVSYELNLDSSDKIRSLFMMTPYAYRTGKEDRERVLALESLKTEVDFLVLVYKKR